MPKNITSDWLPVFETQMLPLGSTASAKGRQKTCVESVSGARRDRAARAARVRPGQLGDALRCSPDIGVEIGDPHVLSGVDRNVRGNRDSTGSDEILRDGAIAREPRHGAGRATGGAVVLRVRQPHHARGIDRNSHRSVRSSPSRRQCCRWHRCAARLRSSGAPRDPDAVRRVRCERHRKPKVATGRYGGERVCRGIERCQVGGTSGDIVVGDKQSAIAVSRHGIRDSRGCYP